jgi:aspartyl-tRNA(Asn)/glutamyl-tRNA(Gln) amidotransferase subunit C
MSVDAATVRRIAHLARIAVAEDEVAHLQGELNAILAFIEQLSEVDCTGVEPMTSVTPMAMTPMAMKRREDKVTDGGIAEDVLRNAPAREGSYFLVPKVVE